MIDGCFWLLFLVLVFLLLLLKYVKLTALIFIHKSGHPQTLMDWKPDYLSVQNSPGNLSMSNQPATPRDDGDMGGNFLNPFQNESVCHFLSCLCVL